MPEPETTTLNFTVTEEGARLDAYLAARIEGWSRARLHQVIADGAVMVNERVAKASRKLRPNDTVEIELPPTLNLNHFVPEDIPLDIIHEDADIIVLNKPAGLVVHPAAGVPSGTLANALAFHFQQLSQYAGTIRPGIVHRLDKDTSGVMVVAKTEAAHENLSDQFRDRMIFKQYVALVHGVVDGRRGEIDQPLGRNPRLRMQMAVLPGGRPALSLWRVRHRFERFTLLDVEIKTGRTHQIRVHLAWLKHPVVGDTLYNSGRDKTTPDKTARAAIVTLGRQFLHAGQIGFRHPGTGAEVRFQAPLPQELTQLLQHLSEGKDEEKRAASYF
jgi:23S rRNA pseudouridine1911/1915/1917 synthase